MRRNDLNEIKYDANVPMRLILPIKLNERISHTFAPINGSYFNKRAMKL